MDKHQKHSSCTISYRKAIRTEILSNSRTGIWKWRWFNTYRYCSEERRSHLGVSRYKNADSCVTVKDKRVSVEQSRKWKTCHRLLRHYCNCIQLIFQLSECTETTLTPWKITDCCDFCYNSCFSSRYRCNDVNSRPYSRRPYNLYCVGADVKPCSFIHSFRIP